MKEMNLGSMIRKLRKQKGITQEALASALYVTPQAVSKWESGMSYPEMTMIPLIAGFFEVSLDTLFDYDIRKIQDQIKRILEAAQPYFFSEPDKYDEMIRSALKEYPGNEELLYALLDSYEHSLRNYDRTDLLDEMIDISYQLIGTSQDYVKVCGVKENLAAAYLRQGKYDKAKEILEELPERVTLRSDAMFFRLSGEDQIAAAEKSQKLHLQDLYRACYAEGDGYFHAGQYEKAMDAYSRGLTALTAFIKKDREGEDAYLWRGMQTFHWGFHMSIAACYKKLGNREACEAQLEIARGIIRAAWKDFGEKEDYYMEAFNEYLGDYDLKEYIR